MKILIDIPEEEYRHLAYADHFKLRSYIESGEVVKVGHWISNAEDDLKISEYTCSNCKGLSDEDSDYCPKCGSYNGGDAK